MTTKAVHAGSHKHQLTQRCCECWMGSYTRRILTRHWQHLSIVAC